MKRGHNQVISGNAKVVRNVNRAVILNAIREKQPISRVQISKLTGINKTTVSSIVADLLDEDLLHQQEIQDRNVGRNPVNLRMRLDKHFVGAINIDPAKTRVGIADINGAFKDIVAISTEPDAPGQFVSHCMDELFLLADRLGVGPLRGLGISVAGIVDPDRAVVSIARNLSWEGIEIGRMVRERCDHECVIRVDNDSKSSALAELWFGEHDKKPSNFVFLSVGRGIGAGIVVEGDILVGQYHAAGEFGHMTMFDNGKLCSCGNYGCWQTYAGDRATIGRYVHRANIDADSAGRLTIEDIVGRAAGDDRDALETIVETGRYLGLGISNILKAADPEAIIVGGRVTQLWETIYPEMMEVISKRAFWRSRNEVDIRPTSLKMRPELVGAATLAIRELFHDYKIII